LQLFGHSPTDDGRNSTNGSSATAAFPFCHTQTLDEELDEELEQASHLPWRCAAVDLRACGIASTAAMFGVATREGFIAQTEDFSGIAAYVIAAARWSLRQQPQVQPAQSRQ
jgi:hypothetical protein